MKKKGLSDLDSCRCLFCLSLMNRLKTKMTAVESHDGRRMLLQKNRFIKSGGLL